MFAESFGRGGKTLPGRRGGFGGFRFFFGDLLGDLLEGFRVLC